MKLVSDYLPRMSVFEKSISYSFQLIDTRVACGFEQAQRHNALTVVNGDGGANVFTRIRILFGYRYLNAQKK